MQIILGMQVLHIMMTQSSVQDFWLIPLTITERMGSYLINILMKITEVERRWRKALWQTFYRILLENVI